MANKKISELTDVSSLTGTEELPVVQGGSTKACTPNQINDILEAALASTASGKGAELVGNAVHIVNTLAALKALAGTSSRDIYVRGRTSDNDGYQGHFVWDSADRSAEVSADTLNGIWVPPNSDATGASGAWRRNFIGDNGNLEWFGAALDGVDDDSEPLEVALTVLDSIQVHSGILAISNATVGSNKRLVVEGSSQILILSSADDSAIVLSGSNSAVYVYGKVDGNSQNKNFLKVTGSYNDIYVANCTALEAPATGSVTQSAVFVEGDYNNIVAYSNSATNDGNTNESGPRTLTLSSTATGNKCPFIYGRDVYDVLVTASTTGTNLVGTVMGVDVKDNVVYHLGGKLVIATSIQDNRASGVLGESVVSEGDISVGDLIVLGPFVSAFNLQDAGECSINSLYAESDTTDSCGNLLRIRPNNTASGSLRIGEVHASFAGQSLVAFGSVNGALGHLSIGTSNITFFHNSATIGSIASWASFTGVDRITFENFRVDIVDNDSTASGNYQMTFNSASTEQSYVGSLIVGCLSSTYQPVAAGVFNFRGVNMASQYIEVRETVWDNIGPYVRPYHAYGAYSQNQINAAPGSGYWKAGKILYNGLPSAGSNMGWVCVTAGTPGTWVPFGGIQSANAYTPSNVTTDRSFDADTVTVAELADVVGTLIADLQGQGLLK